MYNIYITQTNFQPKKFGISVKSFSNSLSRRAVGQTGLPRSIMKRTTPRGTKGQSSLLVHLQS